MKIEIVTDKQPKIIWQKIIVNPLSGKEYLVICTEKNNVAVRKNYVNKEILSGGYLKL